MRRIYKDSVYQFKEKLFSHGRAYLREIEHQEAVYQQFVDATKNQLFCRRGLTLPQAYIQEMEDQVVDVNPPFLDLLEKDPTTTSITKASSLRSSFMRNLQESKDRLKRKVRYCVKVDRLATKMPPSAMAMFNIFLRYISSSKFSAGQDSYHCFDDHSEGNDDSSESSSSGPASQLHL